MLVAVHGFTETDQSWQEVFAEHGLACRCPLLPGHGWRPCPADCTLATVATEIAAGLPAGESHTLLGYSLGGRIALRTALDHPERIERLVLISCRPGIADPSARAARQARDERLAEILEEDGIGSFVAWWESQPVLRPATPLPRSREQQIRCRRLNQDPLGLAAALRRLGQGEMEPLWDRLGNLRMPVLLVVGETDRAYREDMQRMADSIPDARLAVVAGCGHAVHRECPAETVALVRDFIGADAAVSTR